ncbi:response regulator [Maridesulfovibrio ferrireducens]|uniref:response regulator n=1 Tax=Maridesulfovibrio ferrireducens TaxID=246191 RepID=UPI001A1DD35B|nr:response regulator [Maridesulfovibrio ferrireducens]MBI9113061.1 HDOD domain-containing protein [Maridesulfovibrio ferrireducens]
MKHKILFVDDNQNMLRGIKAMLHSRRKEWACRFASNGEDAVELIQQESFDAVVSDIRMPGMNGIDFLKIVEKIQPATIRIILSGYTEIQTLLKSTTCAHQFISKPCSSKTLIDTIQRLIKLRHILNNNEISTMVARLNSLPAIPDLYLKICTELEKEEPSLDRVGKFVEKDPGVSATILKVVNSAFFGFYNTISSPSHAVTLLGTEAVKGLVLGVHLLDKIDLSSLAGYSVDKLWTHSLQTGDFAKAIATLETTDKTFISSCYVAGILHDVGKLIFVTNMENIYKPVLLEVRKMGGPINLNEKDKLGVSHAAIGAYLLGLWGFHENIVSGVFDHHTPENSEDGLTVALVVHAANTLQHELYYPDSNFIFSPINLEWLEAQSLMERLPEWVAACTKFININ